MLELTAGLYSRLSYDQTGQESSHCAEPPVPAASLRPLEHAETGIHPSLRSAGTGGPKDRPFIPSKPQRAVTATHNRVKVRSRGVRCVALRGGGVVVLCTSMRGFTPRGKAQWERGDAQESAPPEGWRSRGRALKISSAVSPPRANTVVALGIGHCYFVAAAATMPVGPGRTRPPQAASVVSGSASLPSEGPSPIKSRTRRARPGSRPRGRRTAGCT